MGMAVMIGVGMIMPAVFPVMLVAVIASLMAVLMVMGMGMAMPVGVAVAVSPVAVFMLMVVVMGMGVTVFVFIEFDLHRSLRGKDEVIGRFVSP